MIVTDHHPPGERLPDCPIVHPVVCGYPFAGLCGAAVAHKLAERLRAAPPPRPASSPRPGARPRPRRAGDGRRHGPARRREPDPDPARARRAAARPATRAARPDRAAKVEPERLDEGDIAFRLAPRLNAAGRLYRADAGVELLQHRGRARGPGEIAAELDAANHERREIEREVYGGRSAALRELPEELREAPGLVLAGEGWHPGVVGIAASRMVERHRPARGAALDRRQRPRPRARAAASPVSTCSRRWTPAPEHLDRFGGHRAAAGVELDAAQDRRASGAPSPTPPRGSCPRAPPPRPERIDAVVGAEALDLRARRAARVPRPLRRGQPGGAAAGARGRGPRTCGRWGRSGKHARFSSRSGSRPRRCGRLQRRTPALERAASRPPRLHRPPRAQPLERLGRAARGARGQRPGASAP